MNKNLKRRAEDVAKAERELSETDAAVPRLQEETRSALARIGADFVAGTITDREADRLREQAEFELDRLCTRADVLRQALPELRQRLAAEEEAERTATLAKARSVVRTDVGNRDRAQKKFASLVRETAAAGLELQRHRGLIEADVQTIGAMLQPGEGLDVDIDEPEVGPEAEALRELLAVPPQRPAAERQRKAEEAASVAERQANELLDWLKRHPSEAHLQHLPSCLQERGQAILAEYQEEHAAAQERQRQAAEAREVLRI